MAEQNNQAERAAFDAAAHALQRGAEYPYDAKDEGAALSAADWAHAAARGILYDLTDRRGIKHGFRGVDQEVRAEIVGSLAEIIRRAALPASVDAVDLPPLPDKWELNMTFRPGGYCETDDAMEKMQAEIKAWREFGSAIAADRRKQALTQPASIGSIEDYAQFHTLHGAWLSAREYWQDDNASPVLDAWRNFIDYIDGRTAAIEAHNRAGKEQG